MPDKKISKILINDEEEQERKIHELIRGRRSLNINTELSKKLTTGQKAADKMATFAGSWPFLGIFALIVIAWGIINTELILKKPFDPYPFVFLNLVLACISAVQAPIIMMSQNRESQKDRLRAENDYLINLKSEIILEDLHMKMDELMFNQKKLKKELNDIKIYISKLNTKFERDDIHIEAGRGKDGERDRSSNDTGRKEPRIHH